MKSEQIFKSFVIFVNGKTIKPIDMKQKIIVLGLATLLLCGCGSTYQATSTLAGASIGGNVGGAIGGLVGSNRHWDGGYRGSAIGTLVGTLAGAAIGGAISSTQKRKAQEGYPVEEQRVYTPQPSDIPSSVGYLQIRNIRFIDENRNHVIESEEQAKSSSKLSIRATKRCIMPYLSCRPITNEFMYHPQSCWSKSRPTKASNTPPTSEEENA